MHALLVTNNEATRYKMSTTRYDRINELRIIDNVGMLDGIDLFQLTDEEFDELESEIVDYANRRLEAWRDVTDAS